MAVVSGDITEVRYSHPTLGSGTFGVKANEDSTLNIGGLRVDSDANMVDGSGRNMKKMNRRRWSASVVCSNDVNTNDDLEKAVALAESPVDAKWTISHISGAVYSGEGSVVGDLDGNYNNGTFPLELQGGLKLEKISG